MTPTHLATACLFACMAPLAHATSLDDSIRARIDGDRTGACLAVALIDGDTVQRSVQCADPAKPRSIDADTAFEIGSVSKTMTAVLLARLIELGKASLDDPLSKHLPEGTRVPTYQGRAIRLRDIVTHTSALPVLPPGFAPANPADPYGSLTPDALLAALGNTKLQRAPGAGFEYSNFAMMLLSLAVTRTAGDDLDTLLRTQLFAPLKMGGAFVATAPTRVRNAQGHMSNGGPTPPWTFATDLAGVGGVRATLEDMTRYVQAQWTPSGEALLDRALARARAPLPVKDAPDMGMNWMRMPWRHGTLYAHEGGTGGFSSLVAFAPDRKRGVVILSDTALTSVGGLGMLGLHLLDPAQPAPQPRKRAVAPSALLQSLAGEYTLEGGLRMKLWHADGVLHAQAQGQSAFVLEHDSAGDFYPTVVDALLRPRRLPEGRYAFDWMQGGGMLQATRIETGSASAPPKPAKLTPAELRAYAGTYRLAPSFALTISERDGALHGQGTGQPAIALAAAATDVFIAEQVGAELRFERDAGGRVTAVTLVQGGQQLRGARTP